jgi:hypothetical protein
MGLGSTVVRGILVRRSSRAAWYYYLNLQVTGFIRGLRCNYNWVSCENKQRSDTCMCEAEIVSEACSKHAKT